MSKKQGEVFGPRIRKNWEIFGRVFHLSPHLTSPEFRTFVFYPRGLCKLKMAIFTNYPKSAKKLAAKFNKFHIFGGIPIWQEIWSPKTSWGHETWRKGKRTPRWCARGEDMLAHPPIDGAEFWTRKNLTAMMRQGNQQKFKPRCEVSTKIDHFVRWF